MIIQLVFKKNLFQLFKKKRSKKLFYINRSGVDQSSCTMSAPTDSYVSLPLRSQKSTSPRTHNYTKLKVTDVILSSAALILKGLNSLPTEKLDKTSLLKYKVRKKKFISVFQKKKGAKNYFI